MMPPNSPPLWLFRIGHRFQSCPAARATIGVTALATTTAGILATGIGTALPALWSLESIGTAALASGSVAAPLSWMMHRLLRYLTVTRSELLAMTTHDATTQAMNLHYFLRRARETIERAGPATKDLCVVLVRLEHIEPLIARHGSEFVDEVLRGVSGACLRQLGAHDLFARHRDDEFVGLVQASHPNQADIALARLRRAIDVLQHIDPNGATVPVTITFGMSRIEYGNGSIEQALTRIRHRGSAGGPSKAPKACETMAARRATALAAATPTATLVAPEPTQTDAALRSDKAPA